MVNSCSLLLAFDGSLPSQAAASLSVQFSRSLNLIVHGLFVVEEQLVFSYYLNKVQSEFPHQSMPDSRAGQIAYMASIGDSILLWLENKCQTARVDYSTDLVLGRVFDQVVQSENEAKILAIGRQGRSRLKHIHRLGNHFQRMAHHVHIPILAAGEFKPSLKRVLIAYDGSEKAKTALDWSGTFQKNGLYPQAYILIVQERREPSSTWVDQVRLTINRQDVPILIRKGTPGDQIIATAEECGADLIIMGGYRYPEWAQQLLGSGRTVDWVLTHTSLPVFLT
jgi:nucleotide-binding universal stress UspA family protein